MELLLWILLLSTNCFNGLDLLPFCSSEAERVVHFRQLGIAQKKGKAQKSCFDNEADEKMMLDLEFTTII